MPDLPVIDLDDMERLAVRLVEAAAAEMRADSRDYRLGDAPR